MSITRIGDAKTDEAAWLKARESLLTSSEMFSWLDDTPAWWSDGPEDVLEGKRGVRKVFDPETETTIAHGAYDEEAIIAKFGYAAGCQVMPDNGLFINDKYPGIGATLFPYINHYINDSDHEFLLECKKSLSVKWQNEVPEYYLTQVQTQLTILEMDYAIIFADTVAKGKDQKWRQYWDMRAYVVVRDPAWEQILLDEGEKFLDALASS